jgi:hypothetical protein
VATLKEYGKDVEFSAVRAQIGKGGDQLMPVFLSREELSEFGEELEKRRGEIFKQEYLPKAKAFPQVRDLVECIHFFTECFQKALHASGILREDFYD